MATDGTEAKTDVTLGAEAKGTPQRTYSEEEAAKLVTDAKTSALADVGRFRAEANKALTAATAAEQRIKALEQAREAAELEAARDDPPELARIRTQQAKMRAESDLATARAELNETKEQLKQRDAERAESMKERNAHEIATRLNVDAKRLVKLSKFTDGTVEAIEDIARDLPSLSERKDLRPDSSRTIGGSASFEEIRDEMIKNPSSDAKMMRYMEAKKAREG